MAEGHYKEGFLPATKDWWQPVYAHETKWLWTLDLKNGYQQVALHLNKKENTVFSTGQSLQKFLVMPFGLCSTVEMLMWLMKFMLSLTYKACLVYLDDVIVVGQTIQKQLDNLQKVFHMFQGARLRLNCKTRREQGVLRFWEREVFASQAMLPLPCPHLVPQQYR
jgi:hypothetical protein